ncbi:MAG: cation diffusion facilitator family transporter [Dehalococcoidales bacterium]|nr:cation diffusion facilitator family transporter [Dehalococcoidales bacterium]
MLSTKENVSRLAIISISALIIMKLITSFVTGSIGIRADAFHSLIDLAGAVIGYIGIKISSKPPDKQHAFGHGKAENISGTAISLFIFAAAILIAYQAIDRIVSGGEVELVTIGIYVTAVAIVINLIFARYALKVARKTDSVALEATARDMLADVYSSIAVLVGLVLVLITGLTLMDSIVALLVALLIFRTAVITFKKSFSGIMDTALPKEEVDIIKSVLVEHKAQIVDFHALRTRKAGSQRFVDLHLIMHRTSSVEEAHNMTDHLEEDLKERLPNMNITIHIEPCNSDCRWCTDSVKKSA